MSAEKWEPWAEIISIKWVQNPFNKCRCSLLQLSILFYLKSVLSLHFNSLWFSGKGLQKPPWLCPAQVQWSPDNWYENTQKIVRNKQNVRIIHGSKSMGKHTIMRIMIVRIKQNELYCIPRTISLGL